MKKPCPFCDGIVTGRKPKFQEIYAHHLHDCPARPPAKKEANA